jgi:hypothetical protein
MCTYRWLLPQWLRTGVRSPFWTAMRWVVRLLIDAGEPVAAAQILGAILSPDAGHAVYGDDTERIEATRAELIEQLGRANFDAECAAGSALGDAAATALVMAAFDRIG